MSEIDAYLKDVKPEFRIELLKIRKIVHDMVPDAVESISYGIPTFKYKGKPLIYYAGFKDHMSIFPTAGPAKEYANRLKGYKIAKGTIQFTLEKPLPEDLIKDIVQYRLNSIEQSINGK